VTIQENAAVGLVDTRLRSFPHAEIFFGDFGDARVKLDRVDRRVRQKAAEIGRDRTAAQAEHQRAVDFLRINCSDAHGARVEHRQIVGISEVDLGLGVVPTLPLEGQLEDAPLLANENIVVDGLDPRDQPILSLEHAGAYCGIEQVFGLRGRDR